MSHNLNDEALRVPVIKLWDNLVVSIQGALSDEMVRRMADDVGDRLSVMGARGLIIDVSGVDILDSYITRVIRDVAMLSSLMGTRTVMCGINPMVAMTLVEMGLELEGVTTTLNLEAALAHLAAHREADERDHGTEEDFDAFLYGEEGLG